MPSPHLPADGSQSGNRPLDAAQQAWTALQRELVAELCDGVDEHAVGTLFDQVHAAWDGLEDRPDPAPLTDAFGVALGDLLVWHVGSLHWCARAADGELVVADRAAAYVVAPLPLVVAAWPDARPGWFTARVRLLRADALAELARPAQA
ncbi:hypothetical protein [Cellulomonas massiliensis]|uniref:hypothetical protein n=1 Tax=Cellulomonas massiliensis TaxID=1465811 RepID=UPI0002E2BAB7|nr:hypothetical protein [Cellulomonas massiliensis]